MRKVHIVKSGSFSDYTPIKKVGEILNEAIEDFVGKDEEIINIESKELHPGTTAFLIYIKPKERKPEDPLVDAFEKWIAERFRTLTRGGQLQEVKTDKAPEIKEMSAADFVRQNKFSNRIHNTIISEEYYNGRQWTVGQVYDSGDRIKNFGKRSLDEFRKKVDELKNTNKKED